MSLFESVLGSLEDVQETGDGWVARCPVHRDPEPDLRLEAAGAKAFVKCRKGCSLEEIREALNLSKEEAGNLLQEESPGVGRDPKTADLLAQLAQDRYDFGKTAEDEPFAVLKEGPRIARFFRGKRSLNAELAAAYRRRYEVVPNASALKDAMLVLEGIAADAEPEAVFLRIAPFGDGVVLDLGDQSGRVIVCTPSGWEVRDASPVLFRRTELTGALPVPERGGSRRALFDLLNVREEEQALIWAFLVSALLPEIPHPIGFLGGEQGSGKSTAGEMMASIIDPGPAVLRTPPRDTQEWVVSSASSWIVVVDNVSRIQEWWADSLCRAVTGEGLVRRRLYTDGDLSVISHRRVVMLTSIDAGALRGDLGDRILFIDLDSIGSSRRRSHAQLWRDFTSERPRILGCLLDDLVGILRELPEVSLSRMSRMADFNRVLAACDAVCGGSSLSRYLGQRERVAVEVLEGDPVGQAITEFMSERDYWSGTADELRVQITPDPLPSPWPKTARMMGGVLRRLRPALREVGIEVIPPTETTRVGRERRRIFTLRRIPEDAGSIGRAVQSSAVGTGAPEGGLPPRTVSSDRPANRPLDRPLEHGREPGPTGAPRHEAADPVGADGSASGSLPFEWVSL